jgi:uncharacterized protein (DUF1501 family)
MTTMNVTRRDMLRVGLGGLGAVSLSGSVPAMVAKFALPDAGTKAIGSRVSDDNVLVIVQLTGGNDGLNTIIPVGNDAYRKARPAIGLSDRLHVLDDRYSLNPGMAAFKELFDDGRLAIVNGCGYPNPNRSHFKSLEIWHTANAAGGAEAKGWLGQYIAHVRRFGGAGVAASQCPLGAINIGPELPQALVADGEVTARVPSADEALPAMQFLARQATNAVIDRRAIERAAARCAPDADYPGGGLGPNLKLIAQLIAANLGTKVFYCQLAGFDTHANQLGQHERLLNNLSSAVAAFTKDMAAKGYGEKVTLMCFSEFGRRVEQNSSGGTDHGAAGPMFVVGGSVKGGIYGAHPSLSHLDDGDLKFTTDFRRVYATLLDRWLNVRSSVILNNAFEPIAFL